MSRPSLLGPHRVDTPIGRAISRIREFLYIPEVEIVYAVLGAAAANMVEGEPVWLMMVGPPGCQPIGSYVLMGDGSWKTVENVVVGDKVISPQHDGSSIVATVTNTMRVPKQPIYEVSLQYNGKTIKSYRCSGNHTVPMRAQTRHYVLGSGAGASKKWVPQHLMEMEAQRYAARGSRFKAKVKGFTSTAIEFPEQKFSVHPYILGAMLGDGSMLKHPNFTSMDQAIFDRLEYLGVHWGYRENNRRGNKAWTQGISGLIGSKIKSLSCFGKEGHDKFIPVEYLRGSISQRLDLLAGLIDTDGSQREFSSCSKQLIDDFVYLVHSVGGFAYARKRTTTCNGKRFVSYRTHFVFGEHKPNLTLKHKVRPTPNQKYCVRHKRLDVRPTGEIETVYGFTLDSPSQWYVTDDWMITHNCGKTEMTNMLIGLRHVHEAANFSGAAAFLSGTGTKEKAKDATGGLLRQVGNHGAIIINDYTSVLSLDPVKRGEVMSILRECYSGRWTRPIGEGGGRNLQWVGKLMVLAGCTNELDRHHQISSAMGERWVYLRFDPNNSVRLQISGGKKAANGLGPGFSQALAALRNSGKGGWRERLRDIATEMYEEVGLGFGKIGQRRRFTDAENLRLIRIAAVSARCRSVVPRDNYTKEIIDISDVEMEARIATALGQLYIGLELIGVGERERWSTVGRVALDSMPRLRRFVLDGARSPKPRTEEQLAELAGCSKSVMRRTVEEMIVLGVVAKDKANTAEGEKPAVKLTAWMKENLEKGWR